MRSEHEIRAAIATLERAVNSGLFSTADAVLMAAYVGALRYAIADEQTKTSFTAVLGSIRETFARIAATPGQEN